MEYYFSKTLTASFDEAVQRTTEGLKTEGFGIISEINIHEKLNEKLGITFKKYRILGACNPGYAYKALQAEDKIGTCCHYKPFSSLPPSRFIHRHGKASQLASHNRLSSAG